jgi:hypothetical protein
MPESLESRLAVALDNIADLQRESERHRGRIHKLESAVRGVEMLTQAVSELQESLPNLARQAAREAVNEAHKRRHADTAANVRLLLYAASVGIAFGALIVSVVTFVVR